MSELAVTLLRIGYLLLLWVFVLSAIGVLRRDLYGTRILNRRQLRAERLAAGPPAATPAPARGGAQDWLPAARRPGVRRAAGGDSGSWSRRGPGAGHRSPRARTPRGATGSR